MEEQKSSEEFTRAAERLVHIVDRLDRDFMARRKWYHSLWNGLMQGAGIAIGATVLFVIIFYLLVALETTPVVGDFASKVIDQLFVERELVQ